MLIVPSIDLLNRKVVRLYQGKYEQVTEYNNDVIDTIRSYEDAGAARIHLVDLDAARGDRKKNWKIIARICNMRTSCIIEVGGGVRSEEDVEALIEAGVDRIVIGTALVKSPALVAGWIVHFGQIFVAGIDATGETVLVKGWEEASNSNSHDLACRAEKMRFSSIVYTDVEQDGTLAGPAIDKGNALASKVNIPVILSGGVGSLGDIQRIHEQKQDNLRGVIVGRALYENKIDIKETLNIFPQDSYKDVKW